MSKITKWKSHTFESSPFVTPDFAQFAREFRSEFKKSITRLRLVVEQIYNGHFEIGGFVKSPATGKIAYFKIGDVRWEHCGQPWHKNILIRTATSTEDHRGGRNQYTDYDNLATRLAELVQ